MVRGSSIPACDADGNMTGDGRFTYTWNDENRMVSASNAEVVVTYAYDHKGRMIRKTISRGAAEPQSIEYLWDGWNIIREKFLTPNSSFLIHNLWGLDLDGTMQGAGGVGGLLAVVRDGETYLPTYDANGNVSEYVSASDGSITAHYDYSPFGETLVASGPLAASFTHRFSNKPYCHATGFCEYQMRKYRPDIGRWMSRDQMEESENCNLCMICENNPICNFDYLGNECCIYVWAGIPGHMALSCDNGAYISKFPDGSRSKVRPQPPKWHDKDEDELYFETPPRKICFSCINESKVSAWYESKKDDDYFWANSSCIEAALGAVDAGLEVQDEPECNGSCLMLALGFVPYAVDLLDRNTGKLGSSHLVTPDMLIGKIKEFAKDCKRYRCGYLNVRDNTITW